MSNRIRRVLIVNAEPLGSYGGRNLIKIPSVTGELYMFCDIHTMEDAHKHMGAEYHDIVWYHDVHDDMIRRYMESRIRRYEP